MVLDICRRYVPSASRVTFIDESGRKARAYFIDNNVVLKVQRPYRLRPRAVEEFETNLEKEAFLLRGMERYEGIVTPRLLGYSCESGVEYICMSRMPGVWFKGIELDKNIEEPFCTMWG
jgi:hypothetical protein